MIQNLEIERLSIKQQCQLLEASAFQNMVDKRGFDSRRASLPVACPGRGQQEPTQLPCNRFFFTAAAAVERVAQRAAAAVGRAAQQP